MNFDFLHPSDQIVMIMRRIYERGMTTTSGGNLSILDDNGDIWITPAAIDKGSLSRGDIILVRPDGTTEGPHAPSSELPFHTAVYKNRPDIKAVLHTHAPSTVAFSIVRQLPKTDLLPSVKRTCGSLRMAKYALPGSDELGENIGKEFLAGKGDADGTGRVNIIILENHGVCIGGTDLFSAFMSFETLEYTAGLEVLANKIGRPASLTDRAYSLTRTDTHLSLPEFEPGTCKTQERAARRDMITLIHRSYRQGLFNSTHGTYSVRLPDGSFLITPFGRDRAYLQESDLVLIKNGAREAGKFPSRAVMLHSKIYENHPGVGAVLLAHPPHIMAYAVTDADFDPRTIPESHIMLRGIKKHPCEIIYTDPDAASKLFSATVPAVIFQNDCVVMTGDSLLQAFDRLEVAEATAHSSISARDIGAICYITDSETAELNRAFNLAE